MLRHLDFNNLSCESSDMALPCQSITANTVFGQIKSAISDTVAYAASVVNGNAFDLAVARV